jgi:hypothetical protein
LAATSSQRVRYWPTVSWLGTTGAPLSFSFRNRVNNSSTAVRLPHRLGPDRLHLCPPGVQLLEAARRRSYRKRQELDGLPADFFREAGNGVTIPA